MWVRNRAGAYAYEKAGGKIGLFLAANKRYLGKRESSPLGYSLQQVKSPSPPFPSVPPPLAPSVHAYTYAYAYAYTPAQSHTRPFPSPRI